MIKKILELKGTDFLKGYSTQAGLMSNGIFQAAVNFNPFELMGYLQPSLVPAELTAPAESIKCLTSWNSGGVGYLYAHGTSKLYQYLIASPYTQSDETAQVSHAYPVEGAIIWKNSYIYCIGSSGHGSHIYANTLPVVLGSEVLIWAGYSNTDNIDIKYMCLGADGNLYVGDAAQPTSGTAGGVIKLTSVTGTSGNVTAGFSIDYGFTVRSLINDGRYLVILADNNSILATSRVVGDYQCRVYFWDMVKGEADMIWDIQDSYLIGGGFKDNKIYVFGYNGIYVCNIITAPKMVWDFRGNSTITKRPTNPYQITVGSNDIFWADGGTIGQNIYALRGTTFFAPYQTHSSTYAHTAIMKSGENLFAAVDAPKIYIHNTGTTRGSLSAWTANEALPQPYSYVYTKVTLKTPLSSGQSVVVTILNSNGDLIANSVTRSYSTDGAKKFLTFGPNPTSASVPQFEDVSILISSSGAVERVTVYGTPSDDFLQQ